MWPEGRKVLPRVDAQILIESVRYRIYRLSTRDMGKSYSRQVMTVIKEPLEGLVELGSIPK